MQDLAARASRLSQERATDLVCFPFSEKLYSYCILTVVLRMETLPKQGVVSEEACSEVSIADTQRSLRFCRTADHNGPGRQEYDTGVPEVYLRDYRVALYVITEIYVRPPLTN